ncbi:MAG: putative 3-demethylubiquinone-9 3-methyltransferase (glyoxalase superfamily) [Arenicella sp.]|jgi:predicted 3-demethylubiquinone-9 3-methyltransferase (glyoxalase superfamily)
MSNEELTYSAKETLRKYVLSLLILPSALLSTVGFALGYAVNDWAKGQAYVEAFKSSSSMLLNMAAEVGKAVDSAENSKQKILLVENTIANSSLIIKEAERNAVSAVEKINSVDVFKTADNQIDAIASAVASKTNVEERVSKVFDSRIVKLENQSSKVRVSTEGNLTEVEGGGPEGVWHAVSYCPTDHYVCGLQQRVEERQRPGGDDSGVNSVKMVCCQF